MTDPFESRSLSLLRTRTPSCNQCYKFETHTDMEEAYASDLATASSQGTILKIKYDGTWYGSGLVGDVSSSSGSYGSDDEEDSDEESAGRRESSYGSYTYRYKYGTGYSFAGAAALLALGGGAVRVRRRTREQGTLDLDAEGDDYVEMAAPR